MRIWTSLRLLTSLSGVLLTFTTASQAGAACRIANQTGYVFSVTSGNASNQNVAAHGTATIAPGKIVGKSKEGKTIGGSCKDGDELVIREEQGIPLLLPK